MPRMMYSSVCLSMTAAIRGACVCGWLQSFLLLVVVLGVNPPTDCLLDALNALKSYDKSDCEPCFYNARARWSVSTRCEQFERLDSRLFLRLLLFLLLALLLLLLWRLGHGRVDAVVLGDVLDSNIPPAVAGAAAKSNRKTNSNAVLHGGVLVLCRQIPPFLLLTCCQVRLR